MSAGAGIPLQEARAIARKVEAALILDWDQRMTCRQISVAGSLRRERRFCGDIEFVAIPVFKGSVNMLWRHLDCMLSAGKICQALKPSRGGSMSTRWGEKYRALELPRLPGLHIEIFLADQDNWGCQLAIRTGPHDYSQMLVSRIKSGGVYRQAGGYLRPWFEGERKESEIAAMEIIPCQREQDFFAAAGMQMVEPSKRYLVAE